MDIENTLGFDQGCPSEQKLQGTLWRKNMGSCNWWQ
jgi:hypothetical protein